MNFYTNSYFLPYTYPYLDSYPVQSHQDSQISHIDHSNVKRLETENQKLKEEVQSLHSKLQNYQRIVNRLQRKPNLTQRRKKHPQIFKCPYDGCIKDYKSNLALNLHIKTKHNGGSIRQRQAYAKLILECQKLNKPIPEININFPPNFVQTYRQQKKNPQKSYKKARE